MTSRKTTRKKPASAESARTAAEQAEKSAAQSKGRSEKELRPRKLAEPGQYVTFRLAGELYGINVLGIREIVEYEEPTPVPMTPEWVQGVLNIRGSVVPVIDLAGKFGFEGVVLGRRSCIIVVELEEDEETSVMGFVVDGVSEVVDLEADEISEPPVFGTPVHVAYLLGVGRISERFTLLLDIWRVLTEEELLQVAALREEGQAAIGQEPGPATDATAMESGEGA